MEKQGKTLIASPPNVHQEGNSSGLLMRTKGPSSHRRTSWVTQSGTAFASLEVWIGLRAKKRSTARSLASVASDRDNIPKWKTSAPNTFMREWITYRG